MPSDLKRLYDRLQPEDDEERSRIPTYMPYIVIIVDEMADLMMTGRQGGRDAHHPPGPEGRAVGIHLILATQKPTVDVITGLIKRNLPARIAFQVASRTDTRVVLDEMGADKLLGNGDMLFLIPGTSHLIRAQGTYVSDAEVQRVCNYLEQYPAEFSKELVQLQVNGALNSKDRASALKERDELYEAGHRDRHPRRTRLLSLLQRALGIGYGRAARLIDFMAEDGIVGEYKSGSGPRSPLHLGRLGSPQERRRRVRRSRGLKAPGASSLYFLQTLRYAPKTTRRSGLMRRPDRLE